MKKILKEFRDFAVKGNVMDMAVGVVVGGAFSKIVSSLVADIVMPALSLITGRINFSDLAFTVPASLSGAKPIRIKYGLFIQNVVDFLVIAVSIFAAVKVINRLHNRFQPPAPPKNPPPTKEELLLTEIRDIMRKNSDSAESTESNV